MHGELTYLHSHLMQHTHTHTEMADTESNTTQEIETLSLFSEENLCNLTEGFLAVLEPELARVLSSIAELT